MIAAQDGYVATCYSMERGSWLPVENIILRKRRKYFGVKLKKRGSLLPE